ncbi:hypothetical protein Q604_UNBC08093G0001, partial [human gut metagenome]
ASFNPSSLAGIEAKLVIKDVDISRIRKLIMIIANSFFFKLLKENKLNLKKVHNPRVRNKQIMLIM